MLRCARSSATALSFSSDVIIKFLLARGMRSCASSVMASLWAGLLQHPSWHLKPPKSPQEAGTKCSFCLGRRDLDAQGQILQTFRLI